MSTPALAADATVANAAELKSIIEALPAGESTITLAPGFAPIGAAPTIMLPAGVNLTLTGPGATIAKEAGASGRHLDLVGNKSQTVTITDLVFEGHNPADPTGQAGGTNGGGVGIREVAAVDVSNSTFSGIDGSAGLALGGVATLTVNASSFMGNRAAAGAAIELPNGINAKISHSTLHKNWGTQPGYSGGALRPQRNSHLTVENSVFTGNVSLTRGGAIAFHQMEGSLTVRDSVFDGNTVPIASNNSTLNDGGAIAVNEMPIAGPQSGKTLITGSTFSNNVAGDDGGALLLQSGNGSSAVIENSTFYANRALGQQDKYDDTSGGGAIEAFGTPLTLTHNTFVNNFAHKGTALFGHQRGGAVSTTGDTAHLKAQLLVLSHNLFVGNDVGFDDGRPAPSSAYRQVSARGGIETLEPSLTRDWPVDGTPGAPQLTADDAEHSYGPRAANPEDDTDSGVMAFEPRVYDINVGVDNGKAIDLNAINREAVLGSDTAAPAGNDSAVIAGDARTGTAQTPGTFVFHPGDEGFLIGLADNIGDGSSRIESDQRKLPADKPADAGSLQQAFIRYDPNGGDWKEYEDFDFDGERIVQVDETAMVWAVGAIDSEQVTEPEPTLPPEGKTFVEWNTKKDGSGTSYPAGAISIPAGNLRLYAIWDDIPVEQGTVTAEYVDENGDPLRDPIITTGDVDTDYTTEQLTFEGYDFVKVEGATTGTITSEPITVRYTYKKQKTTPPIDPVPPVVDPGPGTIPPKGDPNGPLADSGSSAIWPIVASGSAVLLVAAGLLLYGRRRMNGGFGS